MIVTASFISSLCHTRAGIPDAMVTIGAIQLLTNHLFSANEQVRFSCAVALGYLTYNRTASRYLLSVCRNRPGLYDRLMASIGKNPKINSNFVEDFQRARIIGLPCLRQEKIATLIYDLLILYSYVQCTRCKHVKFVNTTNLFTCPLQKILRIIIASYKLLECN